MLATTNSNLDIRVKEPSDGAPPTSGIGGPSTDRFNIFFLIYSYLSKNLWTKYKSYHYVCDLKVLKIFCKS